METFNEMLKQKLDNIKQEGTSKVNLFSETLTVLRQTAEATLPKIHAKRDAKGITDKLYKLIIERGRHLLNGDLQKVRDTDKLIQKQKRWEKQEYNKNITDKELDVRDMHLGIRKIKSEYQPVTYHFKDKGTQPANAHAHRHRRG